VSSLLGLLVSIASLAAVAWWISRQDPPSLPDSGVGFAWLGLAALIIAVNFLLRGLRWHFVMRHARIGHRQRDATGLTLVGYMGNNVLPARGGEVLKIGLLGQRTDSRRREVLGSVVAERVLDAGVLAALFVVLTFAKVRGAAGEDTAATIAAALLVAAGLALAVYVQLRRRGRFERFATAIRPVAGASKLFIRPAGIALALLSLVIWSLDGLSFMLMAHSLDIDLAFLPALAVIVLASLAAAVPAAPGYLGTFDAAMLVGLNAADITGGTAVSLLLMARFMYFVPVTFVGLGVLWFGYGGLRRPASVAVEPRLETATRSSR
jgi:uncharacterized protein (TIRG00374 family)